MKLFFAGVVAVQAGVAVKLAGEDDGKHLQQWCLQEWPSSYSFEYKTYSNRLLVAIRYKIDELKIVVKTKINIFLNNCHFHNYF